MCCDACAVRLQVNVEYNLLDPLLRSTIAPAGDVNDASGVLQCHKHVFVRDSTRGACLLAYLHACLTACLQISIDQLLVGWLAGWLAGLVYTDPHMHVRVA
jgi:hypothetical protein